ncbi:MAG: hypothetical protein ABIK28_04915, partial [Planctomycetota bacterium]
MTGVRIGLLLWGFLFIAFSGMVATEDAPEDESFITPAMVVQAGDDPAVTESSVQRASVGLSSLARLVVLSNGRLKPLATHAIEALQPLFDKEMLSSQDALVVYAGLLFNPGAWFEVDVFRPGPELSTALFSKPEQKMSFMDILAHQEELSAIIQAESGMGLAEGMPLSAEMSELGE